MFKSALLISAAASEAKKLALIKKYTSTPEYVEICAEADPTSNGLYTEWLVKGFKHLDNDGTLATLLNYLEPTTEALREFNNRLKNSPEWKANHSIDIMSYTVQEFLRVVSETSPEDYSKKERERELQRRRQHYLDEGCEFLGSPAGGFSCFKPQTIQASMLLSEGSHWCTKSHGYSQRYLSSGFLYVFTVDDTDDIENHYGSDRFAQCFVPEDGIERFEFQNVDGYNLGQLEFGDRAYYVNEEHWWMITFLAQHDSQVNQWVKGGYLFNDYEDAVSLTQCDECDRYVDDDDGLYVDGINYCSKDCFDTHYAEHIEEATTELMYQKGGFNQTDQDEYEREAEEMIYGTRASEVAQKVFTRMQESGIKLDIAEKTKDGSDTHHYSPSWYISNLAQGLKPSETEERVEKATPGCSKADYQVAYDELVPYYDKIKEREVQISEAIDYVKDNFEPNDMDIEVILEAGGFFKKSDDPKRDHANVMSSFKSALLISAAASEGKKEALAKKYKMDMDTVRYLDDYDPSANGEYLDWLCRESKKSMTEPQDPEVDEVSMDEVKSLLETFTRLKRSPNFTQQKDIFSYGFIQFVKMVRETEREALSKKEQGRELIREKDKYLRDGCEPVAHVDGFSLYRLTTGEALVLMSEGSHWCTKNLDTANGYLSAGPLYVVTKDGGENNKYGSDRYALVRVPKDMSEAIHYIECQDANGRNLGDTVRRLNPETDPPVSILNPSQNTVIRDYDVDEDYFWIFQTLAEVDETINRCISEGRIYAGEWDIANDDDLYEDDTEDEDPEYVGDCLHCGDYLDEGHYVEVNGGLYCSRACIRAEYAPSILHAVRLWIPHVGTAEMVAQNLTDMLTPTLLDSMSLSSIVEEYLLKNEYLDLCTHCAEPVKKDEKVIFKDRSFCSVGCIQNREQSRIEQVIKHATGKEIALGECLNIGESAINLVIQNKEKNLASAIISVLADEEYITVQQANKLRETS